MADAYFYVVLMHVVYALGFATFHRNTYLFSWYLTQKTVIMETSYKITITKTDNRVYLCHYPFTDSDKHSEYLVEENIVNK